MSNRELWPLFSTSVIMAKFGVYSHGCVSTTHTAGWSAVVNVTPRPSPTDEDLSAERPWTAAGSALPSALLEVSGDTDSPHIMQNTKESIDGLFVTEMDHS